MNNTAYNSEKGIIYPVHIKRNHYNIFAFYLHILFQKIITDVLKNLNPIPPPTSQKSVQVLSGSSIKCAHLQAQKIRNTALDHAKPHVCV